MAWLAYACPDICANVAYLSQVKMQTLDRKSIEHANYIVDKVKSNYKHGLGRHEFERDLLELIDCSDSSFANNLDHSTQPCYAILQEDETNRKIWLTLSSYKCRRIVQLVLGGETYVFADCLMQLSHDVMTWSEGPIKSCHRLYPLTPKVWVSSL